MKIVSLNAGLGNHMFQYIFAKYIEKVTGEICLLDDSYFFLLDYYKNMVDTHNGYELDRVFGIKSNLLSNYFSEDIWNEMIKNVLNGKTICQQLLDNGIDICIISEKGKKPQFTGNIVTVPAIKYIPRIALSNGNFYYEGDWLNQGWFDNNKEEMLKEFTFPQIKGDLNKKYEQEILSTDSVAVHIRRGDYVKLGWNTASEIYFKSMEVMSQNYPNCTYFIFSDDINWCKNNYKELGFDFAKEKIVFVIGNFDYKNNYVDMQLMSMCKKMILPRSCFSHLAAMLNKNKELVIISTTTREFKLNAKYS